MSFYNDGYFYNDQLFYCYNDTLYGYQYKCEGQTMTYWDDYCVY